MKKIKKTELLEERLAQLENEVARQTDLTNDLIDYLMRVDANFLNNPGTFDSWYQRLVQLRNKDTTERACAKAKRLLSEEGYVVVKNENDVDAARVKQWLNSNSKQDDDDIPF